MSCRVLAGLLCAGAVLTGLLLLPSSAAEAVAPVPPPPAKPPALLTVLNKVQKFDEIDDNTVTLEIFTKILAEKLDISIDIDEEAFTEDGLDNVAMTRICDKPLPAMKNLTLAQYLRKVLKRVPAPSGATFWVRRDRIEIVPFRMVQAKIWGADHNGPFYPLVNATFDKKALADITQELADEHEVSIVVDKRATEQAKVALSMKFSNTPLDTVLKLMADQAELQTVALDNVIYLTTPERAAILKARRDKDRSVEDPNLPGEGKRQGTGPSGRTQPGGPMAMQ